MKPLLTVTPLNHFRIQFNGNFVNPKHLPFGHIQAHQTAQQKKEAAEESRKDYVSSLNQFNQDQYQHYHTLVPVIYQVS